MFLSQIQSEKYGSLLVRLKSLYFAIMWKVAEERILQTVMQGLYCEVLDWKAIFTPPRASSNIWRHLVITLKVGTINI